MTLETSKQIARISGVTPPPAGSRRRHHAPVAKDTVKPRLAKLKINVAKRRFSVRLSEAASLRVTIEKRAAGKRKGKKCLAPKKGRSGKKCVRWVKVRAFRKAGKAGDNTVGMGKKLAPPATGSPWRPWTRPATARPPRRRASRSRSPRSPASASRNHRGRGQRSARPR